MTSTGLLRRWSGELVVWSGSSRLRVWILLHKPNMQIVPHPAPTQPKFFYKCWHGHCIVCMLSCIMPGWRRGKCHRFRGKLLAVGTLYFITLKPDELYSPWREPCAPSYVCCWFSRTFPQVSSLFGDSSTLLMNLCVNFWLLEWIE